MYLSGLYNTWVEGEKLTEAELHRVLGMALAQNNGSVIAHILRQDACNDTIVERIKGSNNSTAISVWLGSRASHAADFEWAVENLQSNTLRQVIFEMRRGDLSEKQMRLVWKRDEVDLRLAVLQQIRWHHRDIPKTWGTWLLRTYRAGKIPNGLGAFQSLGSNSPEYIWPIVSKDTDLTLMTAVAKGMESKEFRGWHAVELRDRVTAYLDGASHTPEGNAAAAEAVRLLIRVLKGDRHTSVPLAGTPEADLGLRVLDVLPAETPGRDQLASALGELQPEEDNVPRTRDEIIAALAGDTVPETAVEAALGSRQKLGDELWRAVAGHKALTVRQAGRVISGLDSHNHGDEMKFILKGRKPTWKVALARQAWGDRAYRDRIFTTIAWALPYTAQVKFLKELVQEDPSSLKRLVEMHLASDDILGELPVKDLRNVDRDVSRRLLRLTRSELGDSQTAWEIFETLAEDCTGTYGELLRAVKALAEGEVKTS